MAHNYSTQKAKATVTHQTMPIPGKEHLMTANSAGGFSFKLDKWKQLERFLILGSTGGTYYISERKLSKDNIKVCVDCIKEDAQRVLLMIRDISVNGRAHKNDPAIMLLATLFAETDDKIIKQAAGKMFPEICRIGTHVFTFAQYLDDMRSWGRSVRNAIGNWYSMDAGKLEYQMIKYKGRTVEGTNNQWTHKDILRSIHAKPVTERHAKLFTYAVKKTYDESLKLVSAVEELVALKNDDIKRSKKLIVDNKIPHDAWPSEIKNEASIWKAALNDIPFKALLRSLGRLTSIGVLKDGPVKETQLVIDKFTNEEYIKKSMIHPMDLLIARKVYASGRGIKGELVWNPIQKIVDAIETAFYMSFSNITPSGKNILLALDVSGSMSSPISSGILSCAEASALMCMVTARVEKNYSIMAFAGTFKQLNISPKMSFEEVCNKVQDSNFGTTDCSLPIIWAAKNKFNFDAFVVYTDSETYAGKKQPVQALRDYRKEFVKDARLIVVGMTSNGFTIADPTDSGMLDIVGFSSDAPRVISDFAAGKI